MKILFLSPYFWPESVASSHLMHNLRQKLADDNFDMILHAPTPTRGVDKETRAKYKKNKI